MQMKTVRQYMLLAVVSSLMALTPRLASAQDTHYWNQQYGPRSMLLSGAVIGSVSDMSSTFYNPGALGYIEEPELLLSANAYEIETLKVRDGGGQDIDLSSSQFNLLPTMVAGAFRKSWLGENKLAYSILTRYRFNAEVKGGRAIRTDALPAPGVEDFAGAVKAEVDANELWAGLTWARALSPKVGVGVTTYVSMRNEGASTELFAQALTDAGEMALIFDIDNFSSSVYSLLWKGGIGVDLEPLSLGLTVTTPNVRLFGSGETTWNKSVVGLDIDGDDVPDNTFETNFQQDVQANYKSPWAVGFGAAYHLDHTQFHFSTEWYDGVEGYDVLELEDFTSQATGETVDRSLRQKRDSIVNFAFGIQQDLGERYGGYLSIHTDNSSYNEESEISVADVDVTSITLGGTRAGNTTSWMLGVGYAWGSRHTSQLIELDPEQGGGDEGDPVELVYSRITFMIGFKVGI